MADASVAFSTPLLHSSYERSFDAEIDALTGGEILVRGRMRDHRFDFEHTWRLRTPEFEVLEASAKQNAGEESRFNPELCRRYVEIKGARIGRGFSKRILMELDDLPGAEEHLFLAIEMARIGQQVVQLPPGFETQFAQSRSIGASEALFAGGVVRMGFSPELYSPKPGDKRVFWREKRLTVSVKRDSQDKDFYACENTMNDTVHDITIGFDLARDGVISNAHSRGLRLPYHGICEHAQLRTARLNRIRVNDGYTLQFADRIGRSEGCAHLFDLSIDLLRLFKF